MFRSGQAEKLIIVCMHDFAIKYTTAIWALMGVILKIVIGIIALFIWQTVSVSCSCQWQILHIWSGSGAIQN